jgi:hypothetical protein
MVDNFAYKKFMITLNILDYILLQLLRYIKNHDLET